MSKDQTNYTDLQAENTLLRQQLNLYRSIVHQLPTGVYVYQLEDLEDDRTLRMIDANPAVEQLIGIPVTDLVGKTLDEIFPAARAQNIPQSYAHVARSGKPLVIDQITYEDARISQRIFKAMALPLPEQCVAILCTDITERVWCSEAVRVVQQDLERRVQQRTTELLQLNHALQEQIAERVRSEARNQALLNIIPDTILLLNHEGVLLDFFSSNNFNFVPFLPTEIFPNRKIQDMLPSALGQQLFNDLQETLIKGQPAIYEYSLPWRLGDYLVHENLVSVDQLNEVLREQERLRQQGQSMLVGNLLIGAGYLTPEMLTTYLERQYANGNLCFFEVRMMPSGTDEVFVIVRDITERKQAEMQLRYHASLLDSVSDAIFSVDNTFTIQSWNRAAREIYGWQAEEVLGKKLQEIGLSMFVQDRREMLALDRLLLHGQWRGEISLLRKDGTPIDVFAAVSLLKNSTGQPVGAVAVHRDITERKRAEQQLATAYARLSDLNIRLRQHMDLLHILFDGLEDGLLLLDSSGVVQIINRALAALLDSDPDVLVGVNWFDFCARVHPWFPNHILLYTVQDHRHHHRRERITLPDKQVRIVDMHTFPVMNYDRQIGQIILHVVDVTERLEFQKLVIEHETFVASGRLAAAVAHEVNTPLQAIQNFLYLARQASDAKREEYLTLVNGEIQRISAILTQLLDLYRDHHSPDQVDINTLVSRVLFLASGTLAKHRIVVERLFAPDLPAIFGRGDQLTQVVLNLIMNAVDAMPDGGTLKVQTYLISHLSADQPAHASIGLDFTDTGIGIKEHDLVRIFDPFFTTKSNGTGLGLAISRKIIEQHLGTISVRSSVGCGTTFTITLPINTKDDHKKRSDP